MPHAPKHAPVSLAVQVLQTAASLENLAAAAYASAARLAPVREGNPALAAFVATTRAQHAAHARAFNAQLARVGARAQHDPDPRYAAPVAQALRNLTDAASAVSVLESLEDVNAQSYTRYASLADPALRSMFVSVATVEAAHRAFLLCALKLLEAGEVKDLAATPGDLPGALGAASFPHAFYQTAQASAINEGAMR